MLKKSTLLGSGVLVTLAVSSTVLAQLRPTGDWPVHAEAEYAVVPNITYLTATGYGMSSSKYRRFSVFTKSRLHRS